jgi:hypothetical protein
MTIVTEKEVFEYDDELKIAVINQILLLDFDDLYEIYRILVLRSNDVLSSESLANFTEKKGETYEAQNAS